MAAVKNNLYTSIPDWFSTPGGKSVISSSSTSGSSSGGSAAVYSSGSGSSSGSIDVLTTDSTSSPTDKNVLSSLRSLRDLLRKDKLDETKYLLRLLGGLIVNEIQSTNLKEGMFGTGYLLSSNRNNGKSYLEVDELFVRIKAFFTELEIRKLSYTGGTIVLGPAGATCKSVEEVYTTDEDGNEVLTGWKCYINTTETSDHDGTTTKVDNEFRVDDLVYCKTFNVHTGTNYNVSNKYYWRLCTEVGDDYIVLSATDYDLTIMPDVPEAGDAMATIGNRTDVERQSVILQSTVDTMSPSITLYAGINDYSWEGKDIISMGCAKFSSADGGYKYKGFFDVYGDAYIGSRDKSSYMKYSPEDGLTVKGKITVTSNLAKEDEDGNVTDTKQTLQDALDELSKTANENLNTWVTALQEDLGILLNQNDGMIETWFYSPEPTLSNEPAGNWVTEDALNMHLGDLYYSDAGYAYRFVLNEDGTYGWKQLQDNYITKALAAAKQAQDTADGKRRTFYYPTKDADAHPKDSDAYDVGDVWMNAYYAYTDSYGAIQIKYNGDILVCASAKLAGQSFDIDHWTLSSKYTDDSELDAFKSVYSKNAEAISKQLDGTAQMWYQANDPSKDWTTAELKELHTYDLWYCTDSSNVDKYNKTFYWDGLEWQFTSVPIELFDTLDGKAVIYVKKPTDGYKQNDLWILDAGETCNPTDDESYGEGDMLVALCDNTKFNDSDWTKATKYTDDTTAQRAKELANSAQEKANYAASTVVSIYSLTDKAIEDGVIDATEAKAIANAKTSLQTVMSDLNTAINNILKLTLIKNLDENNQYSNLAIAKKGLTDAKAKVDTAYELLYAFLAKLVEGYEIQKDKDGNDAATLHSYYEGFDTAYRTLSSAITTINNEIMDVLNTKISSYAYLLDQFEEVLTTESTEILGGLVQTSTLVLGYHDTAGNFVPMAGTNGYINPNKTLALQGQTVASWWGGNLKDKKYSTDTDAAQALIRMDGSGYFAGGNISWNADGELTATFHAINVGDIDVSAMFNAFNINTTDKYIEPKYPFTNITSSDYIIIGNAKIQWLTDDNKTDGSGYLRIFYKEDTFDKTSTLIHMITTGDIVACGTTSTTVSGSSGGASTLEALYDTTISNPVEKQVLVYDGSHWKNQSASTIQPSLTGYATETWVNNQSFVKTAVLSSYATTTWVTENFSTDDCLPLTGGTLTGTLTSRAIAPSANNTYTLGSSSYKWSNVYATTFTGALSGNASTATKVNNALTITLNGGTTEGTSKFTFDGSADKTFNLDYATKSHIHAITDIASLTALKRATSTTDTGWKNNSTDDYILPTMSFMAYWNGAYESTNHKSNLTYCNQGAFGTIVTKATSDYLASTTKYAGSSTVGGSATSAVKLDSSAGSSTLPVYFKEGKPTSISTTDVGISITGSSTSVSKTVAKSTTGSLVYAAMADNDYFRILVGGDSNAGYVEIATADDGTEPIYVRQYKSTFSTGTIARTATLLDGSGNTSFPGSLTASGEITAGSDMRYKQVVSDLSLVDYSSISNAPIFKFVWSDGREDTTMHLGSSAQYWQGVFPELVQDGDMLSLNYSVLGTIIGVFNSRRIDALEERVKQLEDNNYGLQ